MGHPFTLLWILRLVSSVAVWLLCVVYMRLFVVVVVVAVAVEQCFVPLGL